MHFKSLDDVPEKWRDQAASLLSGSAPAHRAPPASDTQASPMPFAPFGTFLCGADQEALKKLNKTERRFYDEFSKKPETLWMGVHAFRLRLGPNTHYTPDFEILDRTGTLSIVDVKGTFTREDAQLKIKMAARLFPMFRFIKAEWGMKKGVFTLSVIRG